MTPSAFVDYCLAVSTEVATEPTAQPILDAQLAIQFLLPAVLREATRRAYGDTRKMQSLIKSHDLTVNNEAVELPDGVEEEFASSFQIGTYTGNLGTFSYIPNYLDFVSDTNTILPQFTVQNGQISLSSPDGIDDDTEISLYAITVPQLPEDEDDEIEAPEFLMDDCLIITSALLRGEIPLASLGLSADMMSKKK